MEREEIKPFFSFLFCLFLYSCAVSLTSPRTSQPLAAILSLSCRILRASPPFLPLACSFIFFTFDFFSSSKFTAASIDRWVVQVFDGRRSLLTWTFLCIVPHLNWYLYIYLLDGERKWKAAAVEWVTAKELDITIGCRRGSFSNADFNSLRRSKPRDMRFRIFFFSFHFFFCSGALFLLINRPQQGRCISVDLAIYTGVCLFLCHVGRHYLLFFL